MLSTFLNILSSLIHLPMIAFIYYFWQPIANWYLSKIPALGVDLYLSANYVMYHLKNLHLPPNSFKDFWFGGYPLMREYIQMVFYLMIPFVSTDGPVVGVQKFAIWALMFLIVCCYLLFFKLSKNHGVALFLATMVLLSPNIYGALTWAGSIPFFASQAMFPLGLLAGAFYLESRSVRYLAVMALVTGIGFLIHPLGIVLFLIPSLSLIIFLTGFFPLRALKRTIGHLLFFNVGWILCSFATSNDHAINLVKSFGFSGLALGSPGGPGSVSAGAEGISEFYRNQISLLFTRTDVRIFEMLLIGLASLSISFMIAKNKKRILLVVPIALVAAWAAIHPAINLGGIYQIFRQDPYRAFWQFTVASAALAAFLWGLFFSALRERLQTNHYFHAASWLISLVITIGFALLTFVVFQAQVNKTLAVVQTNAEYSSAFPEALGIKIKQNEIEKLKSQLVPSFMNPNDKNTRLYEADATVNIWWNALFEMPMARGYIDPPIGTRSRGGLFWLDIAIANDSLVRDFNYSEEVAYNHALFLIDWNAIGFFEGGRLSSKGPSAGPSSYLLKNDVFSSVEEVTTYGGVLKWQTASGKPEVIDDLPQHLNFYKVKPQLTTPILYPTDTPSVLVFTGDSSYEDILRILATENLNSKRIIPARGIKIDDYKLSDLKAFDAIFLQEYSYSNQKKAFDLLAKYVKEGGKVFIDTGVELHESNSTKLPEIFPFDSSVRKGFGKESEIKGDGNLVKDLDLTRFGPLVFNEAEWKLTVPKDNKLRDGSKVILTHKGNPILIERSLGSGKIIWSGMNLAYHYNQYKSEDEAKLFLNIVRSFADLSEKKPIEAKTEWIRPEEVTIKADSKARGILFKEEFYDGWSTKAASGERLKIYKVGPTFPGFMYVPLNNTNVGNIDIKFTFSGTLFNWTVFAINILAIILMLDLIILNGLVSRKGVLTLNWVLGKRISKWWHKEDEE